MRAVVYRGPNELEVETLPVPAIGPGELLVKVAVCGVCPTDIKKIQHGTVAPPRILGHETAGTIVRVGKQVKGFKLGERVGLHHHVPCLKCHACRHQAFAQCAQYKCTGITAGFEPAGGGYAEYVRVMPFVLPGVVRIPARSSFAEGAMLEPVNTVLKAIRRLNLIEGDTVLVAGQGPIGLMFTRLLALQGIQVVATDLMAKRLKVAQEFGASHCLQIRSTRRSGTAASKNQEAGEEKNGGTPEPHSRLASLVKEVTRGRGLDAAIIAVPSERALKDAQQLVRGGGEVLLFSHTLRGQRTALDLATICMDEKDLLGSYSADFRLQQEVARLVFSRKLDAHRLVTHKFPLEQTAAAIGLAANPSGDSLKIIVSQETESDAEL